MSPKLPRKQALVALAAFGALAAGCARTKVSKSKVSNMSSTHGGSEDGRPMPTIFAAHGAPPLLDDDAWMGELNAWAAAMPKPKCILVISAHWENQPVLLGATRPVPLVYDFYGFPERYYQIQYPSPGAPELAARVRQLLSEAKIEFQDSERGLDHGTYIPLMAMYPQAEIPVLQISLPGLAPERSLELGRALAPLKREGVLIFGSGFLTHNMSYLRNRGVPQWAHEFDSWVEQAIQRLDVDSLVAFRERAPAAKVALPTWEHYVPLLVAAGAYDGNAQDIRFPITGFWNEMAFTRRSVQFG